MDEKLIEILSDIKLYSDELYSSQKKIKEYRDSIDLLWSDRSNDDVINACNDISKRMNHLIDSIEDFCKTFEENSDVGGLPKE